MDKFYGSRLGSLILVLVFATLSCHAEDTLYPQNTNELENLRRLMQDAAQSAVAPVVEDLSSQLNTIASEMERNFEKINSALQVATARDCSDLPANTPSGVHLIRPGLQHPVPAYCDLETDGGRWTLFQRRADIQPRVSFDRDWNTYKEGFGWLEGEFWWGLENVRLMTMALDRRYQLRIDLEDFEGEKRHAVYGEFWVSSEEDDYLLHLKNFTGNLDDSFSENSGKPFSTKDRDNDHGYYRNCAYEHSSGWWFDACGEVNLNGEYLLNDNYDFRDGIIWKGWKGYDYSLKSVEMKIRPVL